MTIVWMMSDREHDTLNTICQPNQHIHIGFLAFLGPITNYMQPHLGADAIRIAYARYSPDVS